MVGHHQKLDPVHRGRRPTVDLVEDDFPIHHHLAVGRIGRRVMLVEDELRPPQRRGAPADELRLQIDQAARPFQGAGTGRGHRDPARHRRIDLHAHALGERLRGGDVPDPQHSRIVRNGKEIGEHPLAAQIFHLDGQQDFLSHQPGNLGQGGADPGLQADAHRRAALGRRGRRTPLVEGELPPGQRRVPPADVPRLKIEQDPAPRERFGVGSRHPQLSGDLGIGLDYHPFGQGALRRDAGEVHHTRIVSDGEEVGHHPLVGQVAGGDRYIDPLAHVTCQVWKRHGDLRPSGRRHTCHQRRC